MIAEIAATKSDIGFLFFFFAIWSTLMTALVHFHVTYRAGQAKDEILKAIADKKQTGTWGAGDVHYHYIEGEKK